MMGSQRDRPQSLNCDLEKLEDFYKITDYFAALLSEGKMCLLICSRQLSY